MKLLIVDDTDFKVQLLNMQLSKLKVEYLVATNFSDAQLLLKQYENEIFGVILDLGFSRTFDRNTYSKFMGIELGAVINLRYPNMPILINSDTEIPKEMKESIEFFDHIHPREENLSILQAFLECCKEYEESK